MKKYPMQRYRNRRSNSNPASIKAKSLRSHYRLKQQAKFNKTCLCQLEKKGLLKIHDDDLHSFLHTVIQNICAEHIFSKCLKKNNTESGIFPISFSFITPIEIFLFVEKFMENLEKLKLENLEKKRSLEEKKSPVSLVSPISTENENTGNTAKVDETSSIGKTENSGEEEGEEGESSEKKKEEEEFTEIIINNNFFYVPLLVSKIKEDFFSYFSANFSKEEIIIPKNSICHCVSFKGKRNQNEDCFSCVSDLSSLFGIKLIYSPKIKKNKTTTTTQNENLNEVSKLDEKEIEVGNNLCIEKENQNNLNKNEKLNITVEKKEDEKNENSKKEEFEIKEKDEEDLDLEKGEIQIDFYSVFDGHRGLGSALICKIFFGGLIIENLKFSNTSHSFSSFEDILSVFKESLNKSFLDIDKKFESLSTNLGCKSGNTCTIVLVLTIKFLKKRNKKFVLLANCGDSSGFISENGKIQVKTLDDKPTDPKEKERIEKEYNGRITYFFGNARVMGELGVTRSIGDYYMRKYGIVPDPHISIYEVKNNISNSESSDSSDAFFIIASDGLWDVVSLEFANNYAIENFNENNSSIASGLAKIGLNRNTKDNITIVFSKI